MKRLSKFPKKETFVVVMPCYNEEKYIKETIYSWIPIINSYKDSEILIINDGSTDQTSEILKRLKKKHKFIRVVDKKNEGHGKAIIDGYKIAITSKHKWIFQTDSDGHFNPSDFHKLWKKKETSNFILGYRKIRKDTYFRKILSKLISLWILIVFNSNIKDPNIPFRLINKDYLNKIIKGVPKGVFAPNIFLSIIADKDGNRLHHIPVDHKIREKSNNLNLLKGALIGFGELTIFAFKTQKKYF